MTGLQAEIENVLTVPPEIMFPLELNLHLRETIKRITEEKWELMEKYQCEEVELKELQKYKQETKHIIDTLTCGSNALISTKFIELNKKNRELGWQNESMKCKMAKLIAENEAFRENMNNDTKNNPKVTQASSPETASQEAQNIVNTKAEEEIASLHQQLTKATGKMMEYRRQNQVISMELRTAQRALAQEVGEGVTPKTVLKEITSIDSTWRGRQQQIIALQQKLADAQLKINALQQQIEANLASQRLQQPSEVGSEFGDQSNLSVASEHAGGDYSISSKSDKKFVSGIAASIISSASKRCVANLQQQDAKKRDKIEKLSDELDGTTNELKSATQEIKAYKARNHVLEDQVRSLRIELDSVKMSLQVKQEELKISAEEVHQMRLKLVNAREQDKLFRDRTLAELLEANQAVTKERAVVECLQKLLAEKQEALQKLDSANSKLQEDLQVYAKNSYGSLEASQKIKNLETQLQYATHSIQSAERERERLLNTISNSNMDIKRERRLHCDTELLLVRAFAVMKQADECINSCLDVGQVMNKSVLQEVEDLRSAMRQLNARNDTRFEADDIQKSPRLACAASKEAAVLNEYIKKATKSLGRGLNHLTHPTKRGS